MDGLQQAPSTTAGHARSARPRARRLARAVARALSPLLPILACALPGLALAAPHGADVVDGAAAISRPDATTTLIEQSSNRLAIDWQRFSIGSDEYVRFVQPGAGALALNRVVGGDPSAILGRLSANGQVFLVNPNGVYFGQGATVDVGGLVASVLDIASDDFMRGDYLFTRAEGYTDGAGVVNDGHIGATDGGYVALLGERVANDGVIAARLGSVALAAGRQITLDIDYRGLVGLAVDEAALGALAGIDNGGDIAAAGGRVLMQASVADRLIDTVINNDGAVVANSIVERDGVIYLAAAGGDIANGGLLDASATSDSNAAGGRVLVHADGDVDIAAGASIRAAGDGAGDGGTVRVIAGGRLEHRAGAAIGAASASGRGGVVEVSGHGSLALRGAVTVGAGGHVLVDPATLTLLDDASGPVATIGNPISAAASVGRVFVENQLNSGADVTLVASSSIAATDDAAFTLSATDAGAGNLTLAIGSLAVGAGSLGPGVGGDCALDGFCAPGTTIVFTAGAIGSIDLDNVGFDLAGGLNVAGGTAGGTISLGNISAGGDIAISGGGDLVIAGAVISAAGDIAIRVGGNVNDNGANRFSAGGAIDIDAGGDYDVRGQYSSVAGIRLHADGDLAVNTDLDEGTIVDNYDIALSAGNHVDIGGVTVRARDLALTGDSDSNGGGNVILSAAATVEAFGDLTIGGQDLVIGAANVTVNGALAATLNGTVAADQSNIDAGAIHVSAPGDLSLQTNNLVVGSGTVAAVAGDAQAIDFIVQRGATAPTTANPNASFVSGGALTLAGITLQGEVPHLRLEADSTSIGGLSLADGSDLLVQFTPYTRDATIGLEASPGGNQAVNYSYAEHFGILPGTTVIVGSSAHRGDIVIGERSSVDIGSRNLVTVTARRVDGLDKVISTGVVASLLTAGVEAYVAPAISEIEFQPLLRIPTDDETEERRKRRVSSEQESPNMCEAS